MWISRKNIYIFPTKTNTQKVKLLLPISDTLKVSKYRQWIWMSINYKWNTGKVTNMYYRMYVWVCILLQHWLVTMVYTLRHRWRMFHNATSFNGDLSTWNTSQVVNMKYMFADASAFVEILQWLLIIQICLLEVKVHSLQHRIQPALDLHPRPVHHLNLL